MVFISSESARPPAEMVHYGMTKTAQLSVARGLAETCTGPASPSIPYPRPDPYRSVSRRSWPAGRRTGRHGGGGRTAFFANARPTSIIKRLIDPAEGRHGRLCLQSAVRNPGAAPPGRGVA